ncbi:hypothetical protein [Cohnella herbarum]|uniref:Uncharacterized protein n=1 Tax=Cohnella herbarum TaxID=2728023 RepID=A0A7Z2VGS7_9BACL|nr:hypothetical protein [Cohnella herbarum]QJD82690.1 hypothetical protein HH215_05490 [Cohnella herbarum]
MNGPVYVVTWMIMLLLPLIAAWKRKWWPFLIYAIGIVVLLNAVLRNTGEWDDLGDFATLIVIVFPIYIAGTILWILLSYWDRRKLKKNQNR